MKSTYFIRILLAFLFTFSVGKHAMAQQNLDLIMGDRFFDKFEFADALYYYGLVADQMPNNPVVTRKIAESYRRMGQLAMSAEWYRRTLELDLSKPEDMLHYAEALKSLQEYDEAYEWYGRYNAVMPNDRRVASHLHDPNYYRELQADSLKYVIKKLGINTSYPAIGVSRFVNGKYLISSMRLETPTLDEKKKWEKEQPYLDVYVCDLSESDDLIQPQKLDKNVNSKYHDGPVFFCEKDQTLYITRNNIRNGKPVRDKKGNVNLKIYAAPFKEGTWGAAQELKFNGDNFSNGHPCLSKDGNFLYFVSNRDGGFGGTDIYVSQRIGESWGEPINLGPKINTEGDEMFPFIASNGALYFASNGWAGLGGLDIFRSDLSAGKWTQAINIGFPINTSQDDFGILYNNNDDSGFFCSNRNGNGNDDVFFFNTISLMKMILAGTIHSDVPGKSLAGEKILVTSTKTGEVLISNLNDREEFAIEGDPGDKLEIRLADPNYSHGPAIVSYQVPEKVEDPFAIIGTYYATPENLDALRPDLAANTSNKGVNGNKQETSTSQGNNSSPTIEKTSITASDGGVNSGSNGTAANGTTSSNQDSVTGTNGTPNGSSSNGTSSPGGNSTTSATDGNHAAGNNSTGTNAGTTAPTNSKSQGVAHGIVMDNESNTVIPYATITYTGNDGQEHSVMSDEKGKFTITGDVPSKISIRIEKLDYLSCTSEISITDTPTLVSPLKVKMQKPVETTMVEVTGIINGDKKTPLAGVKVTCLNSDGTQVVAYTDSKGQYTLKTYEQKSAVFSFEKEGYDIDSQSVSITANASGKPSQKGGNAIVKTADRPIAITGTVLSDVDSQPIAGATVTCKNADGSITTATTDKDGNYSLTTYEQYAALITINKDGYLLDTKTVDPGKDNNNSISLNMTLKKSAGNTVVLSGTILDPETKKPVPGATVTFKGEDGSIASATTDQLGRYSMNVNANLKANVLIEKDGYELNSTDIETPGVDAKADGGSAGSTTIKLDMNLNKSYSSGNSTASSEVKKKTDYEQVVDLSALSIDNVLFDYDKAYIREDAKPTLDHIKVWMDQYPTCVLIISTHSDSRGSLAYNQQLSMSRAMSVKGYLLKKGIPLNRMKIEYFGETKPLNGCTDDVPCTEEQYEINRRAEFMLVTHVSANK